LGAQAAAKVVPATDVELVLDAKAELGEGPVWDDRRGELWWVDLTGHQLHRWHPAGTDQIVVDSGENLASLALTEQGGVVFAVDQRLARLSADGTATTLVTLGDEILGSVLNDSGCDPSGNLWIGISTLDEAPGAGCLRSVTPELRVRTVLGGLTIPNGIDWSPDGSTVYFVDSPTRRVDAFRFDGSGSLGRRSLLAEVRPEEGIPDGLTVDAEGGIWVAFWDGWSVRRYLPNGVLDVLIEVPVAKVTSCALGGPRLTDLYITTASCELSAADKRTQPAAGGLFRASVEVPGLPARRFPLSS
jgi:sugar lactone lactonase YvrE